MPGRQERDEIVGLEDKAHFLPADSTDVHPSGPAVFLKDRLTVKDDLPLGGFQDQAGAQQHGGLARTAGTQQGYQISLGHGETDIFQGPHLQTAGTENFRKAFNL